MTLFVKSGILEEYEVGDTFRKTNPSLEENKHGVHLKKSLSNPISLWTMKIAIHF